jgi:hypothetical protein
MGFLHVQTCKRLARTSVIQLWSEPDAQAGKNDSALVTGLPLVKIGLSTPRGDRFITLSAPDNLCNALDAIRPQNVQLRRYRFSFVG